MTRLARSIFRRLPPPIKTMLYQSRDRLARVRASTMRAREAFRTPEYAYKLAVSSLGGFQVAYRSDTADERVLEHSFDNDIFFTGTPEYVPTETDVIVDVGAHIGTFALLAARKAPKGRVYAIEASRETYDYLRINVALNKLTNVETSHLALGGDRGHAVLHHDLRGNWGHSIMKPLSSEGEHVPMSTLADYFTRYEIGRCDFMKFNCEGAEFPILLNTPSDTLAKIRQMLILYHCDLADRYSLDSLLQHLASNGFRNEIRNRTRVPDRGWIIATR